MKTIIINSVVLTLILFSNTVAYSQFKVLDNGSVTIDSYAPAWGSALKTTVHDDNACAYHLYYNGADKFFVHASGYLWCQRGGYFGSDLKLKKDISKINSPLSTVLKLNGIQFNYLDKKNSLKSANIDNENAGFRLGLVAQEVEKVLPGIVKTMPDSTKAVAYTDLTALLVEAIKEQYQTIENLQEEILDLNEKVSLGSNSITDIQQKLTESDLATLSQNKPNPFNRTTEISYFLPNDIVSANIYVYDLNGSQLKNIEINNRGNGVVTISGSELKAGMYHYVLVANGQIVDTKKMILFN